MCLDSSNKSDDQLKANSL